MNEQTIVHDTQKLSNLTVLELTNNWNYHVYSA